MFETIRADMMRVHRCEKAIRPIDVLCLLWKNHGLRALMIYRFGRWLSSVCKHRLGWIIALFLYPVYWILSVCMRRAYGINLDQSATIAPGFYIGHFGGIEIKNCRIGPHCNIQQQVKLGSVNTTNRKLVIGEGVYIGAHSQIFEEVRIGNGVTIGAGTVVHQDIPNHCLVLGNPGRITQRNYDNRVIL